MHLVLLSIKILLVVKVRRREKNLNLVSVK